MLIALSTQPYNHYRHGLNDSQFRCGWHVCMSKTDRQKLQADSLGKISGNVYRRVLWNDSTTSQLMDATSLSGNLVLLALMHIAAGKYGPATFSYSPRLPASSSRVLTASRRGSSTWILRTLLSDKSRSRDPVACTTSPAQARTRLVLTPR